MGTLQKEAESKIRKLQDRYSQLSYECNELTEQIKFIKKIRTRTFRKRITK